MALHGIGASGINELTWLQDDYDTLAGYNIYRSTSYDATKPVSKQNFGKVNSSVVDTACNESPASNVICCTPADTEPPVITHSAIESAVLGAQIGVNASVTDNFAVKNVTLHYRTTGGDWKTAEMNNLSGSKYRAVISSYEITQDGLEYYITATEEKPFVITVKTDLIESDISTEEDTDSNIDLSSDSEADTNIDTETDLPSDTESYTQTDTRKDTEEDTSTDAKSDTDTSSDTGSDTLPDISDEPIGNLGDVDGDGEITAADAIAILRQSVELENFDDDKCLLADVDGDGEITAADALEVLRYSVGLSKNENIDRPIFRK